MIDPKDWAKREPKTDELRESLEMLEFGSILRELDLGSSHQSSATYQRMSSADIFFGGSYGFVLGDINNPMSTHLEELAVAQQGAVAAISEQWHTDVLRTEQTLCAIDAKALSVYALKQGVEVSPGDDPLLMAYVLDPNTSTPETATRRYGTGEWGKTAISRATVCHDLLAKLRPELTGAQKALYETIEQPLQQVLAQMEYNGVRLDAERLKEQSDALAATLEQLEKQVKEIADNPKLNLNSRDQLADLLFDKLELQAGKKTSTGKRSTAVTALEPLRDEHEVVGMILDYRELAKLKNTYLDPLPALINPDTGRVHTTFKQTVVATGRLSSINPNLQNIPIRTDVGRQIRKAFIAEEGAKLLVADYSQIELRILAHVSGEEALIDAFKNAEDIHTRTAAQIYGTDVKTVDSAMRRTAKIINFGVLYGMSAHRLTRELGIEYKEASAFISTYFDTYPKVQAYIDTTLEFARKRGYVETMLGRRRYIPDIGSNNRNAREYAERTAYNMPIQGAAADIMKLAMLALAPKLEPYDARLTLQVHDELIVEVPENHAKKVAELMQDTMESAYELAVPLATEVGIGDNWLEAK